MADRKGPKGRGTVYREAGRATLWVAEKWLTLPDGRRLRVRTRAETQGQAIEALEAKARRTLALNPGAEKILVQDYFRDWLTHKQANVRASTMRAYSQDVRLYIRPVLGKHRLARLSTQHCQSLIDSLTTRGKYNMADRVRRTLKQGMRHAVKWGLLTVNPMDRVDPVRKPTPKRGTYTMPQLHEFLAAAEGTKLYPFFLLALSTGMRKGEVLALKWSDLDPDGVHVRRTVSLKAAGDGTTGPKTNAGVRFIPVDPGTMRVILDTRKAHATDDEWVFTTRNGKRHSVRQVSRAMRDVQRKAGLPELRFHDFRRSYATQLAEAGHHPRVIQALLGHSTPTLAMTIYTEATERAMKHASVNVRVNTGGRDGGSPTGRERHATEQPEANEASGTRTLEA